MFLAIATTAIMSLSSTSYCLSGTMADGTRVRSGSVAMNSLPLGSRIRLVKPKTFYGKREFIVRDRVGWGSQIDFWAPKCEQSINWGRRKVVIRVIKRGR